MYTLILASNLIQSHLNSAERYRNINSKGMFGKIVMGMKVIHLFRTIEMYDNGLKQRADVIGADSVVRAAD